MHCAAVAAASAVSVIVIDWTMTGAPPPTWTRPTRTPTVLWSLAVGTLVIIVVHASRCSLLGSCSCSAFGVRGSGFRFDAHAEACARYIASAAETTIGNVEPRTPNLELRTTNRTSGVFPPIPDQNAADLLGSGHRELDRIVLLRPIHDAVDEPGDGVVNVAWKDRRVRGRVAARHAPQHGWIGRVDRHPSQYNCGPCRMKARRP